MRELIRIKPDGAMMPNDENEPPSGGTGAVALAEGEPAINVFEAELVPPAWVINKVTFCTVKIAGKKVRAIVDTGATQCVLA